MAWSEPYRRQVALLLRVLPQVAEEDCFALKGGTAINLFFRNMPRLSVDIDLTYLAIAPREASLADIDSAMRRIANRIQSALRGVQIVRTIVQPEKAVTRLLVRHNNAQIKIEVTPVLRGCVFAPERLAVTSDVEEIFGFAEMQVVSFADLYAGKIVAALDRQHPRDFFDVQDILANEGITDELRQAFLVYLISHNRPMAEILAPSPIPLQNEFARGFAGMTREPVSVESLEATREVLIRTIVRQMPQEHRHFLLSFETGKPDWGLLGLPAVTDLPAVQWRQRNLDQLSPVARVRLVAKLEEVLLTAKAGGGSS